MRRPSRFSSFASVETRLHFRIDRERLSAASEESSETSSVSPVLGSQRNNTAGSSRRIGERFIILHYSPFKAVWDWVVILLVLYTGIITPYTISFLSDEDQKRTNLNAQAATRQFNRERTSIHALILIDVLVDMVFILDILISFRTTFVLKETNEVITSPILIAKHFVIDNWRRFGADILGALPWDILFYGNGSHSTMRLANCFKLARLLRLIEFIGNFQNSEYSSAVLVFLMLLFAIAAHWLACIFHFIAILERPNLLVKYSWLDHLAEKYEMPYLANDTLSGPDLKSKYLTALFFAMTSLTSVGFGNVAANTNGEKLFSILSMLAGSFLSASILGSVTTIIIKLYQGAEELKEMKQSIDDFIKHHRINKLLAKRMEDSFEHEWKNTKGIDMNSILKTFPECIQADICLHLNRELLNNCPVFEDADEICLRALALLFKSTHIPPGDTLIHQGDILHSIYFVRGGQVEIFQNNELLVILGRNDTFGENPCNSTTLGKARCVVRGLTYCTLNTIDRDDLLNVFQLHPDFEKSFVEKFHVTFDLQHCEFTETKPFYKLDTDLQMLIKERNPKLQKERRLSVLSEREDEANRLANLRSYRMCRSTDIGFRRSMNTTVELSADQAQFNSDHFLFSRDRPLTTLLIPPMFFPINIAIPSEPKTTTFIPQEDKLKKIIPRKESNLIQEPIPIKKYENSSIRNMKDVDTELSLLQIRVDNFERVIENQMKVLFDVANNIVAANIHRQNNFNQSNETMDTKNCLVINNLLFSKDK
ncbi:unnamed protein product [Adineta steineri]|uniref:Cyclic nucleotide-binding domain-containing protein n=1 Tax=Adineta steineri TaxID=433720 RepID=A0A819FXE2_9BILA|nr:unnamed protein product [Adineta steineri]